MSARPSFAALSALALALAMACKNAEPQKESPPPPTKTAAPTAQAKTAHDGGGTAVQAPFVPETLAVAKSCRVLTLTGKAATSGGAAIERGAPLDGKAWIDLEKDAALTVKHTTTGRELTLTGPAHFLPCDRGDERYVVTRGRIATTTWAGARPGVEVLIATPFALVRYGDARLEVTVEAAKLSVKSLSGEAWIADGKDGSQDRKVAAGAHDDRSVIASDPTAAVALCEAAATAAEDQARKVLTSGARALGELAAAHVRARRTATAACAIAQAALGRGEPGPEASELSRKVASAEARYRSLPSLLSPQKD